MDSKPPAAHQPVHFSNREGQQLAGILDTPTRPPRAYALFAHCFTCSKNLKAVARITGELTGAGIAVLRFDFTGLGDSEGDFTDTTFSSNVADLLAAADYLERAHRAPALLIGHSLGGAAMLRAAADLPAAVAVATIAAPASPDQVIAQFDAAVPTIRRQGQAVVQLAGRPFTIKRDFLDDLARHPLPDGIATLGKALLILHSPGDATVDIGNAATLFQRARHPKSFVSLDDADHLLSRAADAAYVGRLIATWAERYLFGKAGRAQAPSSSPRSKP